MNDASLRPRPILGDRYVLEGLIGHGGMAQVYRAHDRVLERSVAVKVMRNATAGEGERARFANEARTLARLSHPGLVTILDAATADDVPYLVMELVDGPSLAACCHGVALAPARVAAIGAQLADALGHAHEAGVVHRDLKPGNVLLGADDRAWLSDFGIARLISDTVRHTTTGITIGTAAYLAPEQVSGEEVTPAADVYSLGLVLLEALTGQRAYCGLPVEAALARLTTPPTIPDAVPSAWHGLLRAMTALAPADRPSAAAVAASLRGIAAGSDPAAATAALRGDPDVADTARAPLPAGMHSGGIGGRAPGMPSRLRRVAGSWRWALGPTAAVFVLVLLLSGAAFDTARGGGAGATAAAPHTRDEPRRSRPEVAPHSLAVPDVVISRRAGGGQPVERDDARVQQPRTAVQEAGGASGEPRGGAGVSSAEPEKTDAKPKKRQNAKAAAPGKGGSGNGKGPSHKNR